MLKTILLLSFLLLLLPVFADSLWTDAAQDRLADTKARSVGDLLTVIIVEESSASTLAQHTTGKAQDASAGAGTGLFSKFPGFAVKSNRTTNGSGSATASTRLDDRITVRVTEVLPNGILCVEGVRNIKLEKDEMQLVFSGTVRQEDITPDNCVESTQIADQRLESKGNGPIAEKQRPGLLSRLLAFIW